MGSLPVWGVWPWIEASEVLVSTSQVPAVWGLYLGRGSLVLLGHRILILGVSPKPGWTNREYAEYWG